MSFHGFIWGNFRSKSRFFGLKSSNIGYILESKIQEYYWILAQKIQIWWFARFRQNSEFLNKNVYLDIDDNTTHEISENPSTCHVPNHRGRCAKKHDQHVSHGQIDNENISHTLHRFSRCNSDDDLKARRTSMQNYTKNASLLLLLNFPLKF